MTLLFAGVATQGCGDGASPNPNAQSGELPSDAQGAYDLAFDQVTPDLTARAPSAPKLGASPSLTSPLHLVLTKGADAWSASVSALWGEPVAYDVAFSKDVVTLTPRDAADKGVRVVGGDVEQWRSFELRRDFYGALAGKFTAKGEVSPVAAEAVDVVAESSSGALARDKRKPELRVSVDKSVTRQVNLPWDRIAAEASEPLEPTALGHATSLRDSSAAKGKAVNLTPEYTADPLRNRVLSSVANWSKLPAKTLARITAVADASSNIGTGVDTPIEWLPVPEPQSAHTFESGAVSNTVAFWGSAAKSWDARVCETAACAVVGPFEYTDKANATSGLAARVTLGAQSKVLVRYRVLAASAPTQLGAASDAPWTLGAFETALVGAAATPKPLVVAREALVADASLQAPFTRATAWQTLEIAVPNGAGKQAGFATTANLSAATAPKGADETPIPFEIVIESITGS